MKKLMSLLMLSAFLFIFLACSEDKKTATVLPEHAQKYLSDRILTGRIYRNNHRYDSLAMTMQLLHQRNAKILVETGTARGGEADCNGAGGSTIIFGDWAYQNDAKLFSVDINPSALQVAQNSTIPYADNIEFVCSDSVKYLSEFDKPIDFLYLDSFDFVSENPTPSQEHHLKEIIAVYPKLHEGTIILIDDCGPPLPYGGKGKLAINYLTSKGWKKLYDGYQVLLVR